MQGKKGSALDKMRRWIERKPHRLWTKKDLLRGVPTLSQRSATVYLNYMGHAGFLTVIVEPRHGAQHQNHENLYRWDGMDLNLFRVPAGRTR